MADQLTNLVAQRMPTDIGLPIPERLRKLTVLLFKRDPRLCAYPELADFVYSGRQWNVAPAEVLLHYFRESDVPEAYRQAVVEGCRDCMEELKKQARTDTLDLQILYDLGAVIPLMGKEAPTLVAPPLSPVAHVLLDVCLEHNVNPEAKRAIASIAVELDSRLPWNADQQKRWLQLLDEPFVAIWAFNYIMSRDSRHPILDDMAAEVVRKLLTGREMGDVVGFLYFYLKERDGDEAFIARIFGQIPEELHPQLVPCLQEQGCSQPWLRHIPVRETNEFRVPHTKLAKQ